MGLVCLQLSDIHIVDKNDPIVSNAEKIAAAVRPYIPSASHIAILVAGDIAFSGKVEEYVVAEEFLQRVRTLISAEASCGVSILVVPGNHDCDFQLNTATRRGLIAFLESKGLQDLDESVVETCTSVQKAFLDFSARVNSGFTIKGDDLCWTASCSVDGKDVEFLCLNVSWVSQLKEDPGRLLFPVDRYVSVQESSAAIRICLMHHPINWFSQAVYRPFRKFVRKASDLIITGHEHQGNVGLIEELESGSTAFIEGCVLQDHGKLDGSSFNVLQLDIDGGRFSFSTYMWDGEIYRKGDAGEWSELRPLPTRPTAQFPICGAFQAELDDPGGAFRHSGGQQLKLADLFVHPDLLRAGDVQDDQKDVLSSKRLFDIESIRGGVVLEAEDNSGATSLLFRMYRHYHETGLLPIYLKGREIRRATADGVESAIERAVISQYGGQALELVKQLEMSSKVIFVDDFDECPVKASKMQCWVLGEIGRRFGGFVVVVSPVFEVTDILTGGVEEGLSQLEHFKLQQFGYKKRTQLVQRWYSLGVDGTEDEATYIAKCDQAEKVMNVVMAKSIVPSLPLYLLTLLQSIEAGRSGDLRESSLGYYYQFLITQAFMDAGVKQDRMTELFQYSSLLAWHFHQKSKKELTEDELREFNSQFSKDWHTVDFLPRLETLQEAKILRKVGGEFEFWYPYVYYYLKGKYVSENLSDPVVSGYVQRCCRHLYVREHANTILFLAHHTNDEFVLDSIVAALTKSFEGVAPIKFNGDCDAIKDFIGDAPKLVYKGGSPNEHRVRRGELRDQSDDGQDGLADAEEADEALSLIARLTMMFKTAEILGQILKNQYAKIKRPRKTTLVGELFTAPMRALSDFYSALGENPDGLVAEIEAEIKKRDGAPDPEVRKAVARKVVSEAVHALTLTMVVKASQSANAESLRENIKEAVRADGSIAFRLIELAIELDTPKPIPRQALKRFLIDVRGNGIVERQLRLLILNRLYMFKTTESDMRWLASETDLNLVTQHRISYQVSPLRQLK